MTFQIEIRKANENTIILATQKMGADGKIYGVSKAYDKDMCIGDCLDDFNYSAIYNLTKKLYE